MSPDPSKPASGPSGLRNIRLVIEYDGTDYAGWQRQKNGVSVQQRLEEALGAHIGSPVRLNGSGRTDAGVHALGQVANFHTDSSLPARAIWRGALEHLPPDIAIVGADEVPPTFDARRGAVLRWYRFHLLNRDVAPAAARQYLTHVSRPLDRNRMREAAATLSGEHDFRAFRAASCTATRTRLLMHPIRITEPGDGILLLDFWCRSFLQNMVRILAGSMVACGRGQMDAGDLTRMLEHGERNRHAVTLAPNGLFLQRVCYPGDELPLF